MTDSDLERRLEQMFARDPGSPVDTDVAWRRFIRLRRQAAVQRRVIAAGVAVAVVAATAVGAAFAHRGNRGVPSLGTHVNHFVNTGRLGITARIAVPGAGGAPGDEGMAGVVTGQGGQVWAITYSDRLIRIDPATNRVTLHTHIAGLTDMTAGAGVIWLLTTAGVHGELLKLDPVTGSVVATLPLPRPCDQVSYAGGQLWLACATGRASTFLRLDQVSGRVLARGGPAHGVYSIAATGDGIWYAGDSGVSGFVGSGSRPHWVNAADPQGFTDTNSLIFADGAVWAFDGGESVAKIDPETGRIIRVYDSAAYDPSDPSGLDFFAVGQNSLWFLNDGHAAATSVLRVSLASGLPLAQASGIGSCGEPCWQIYAAGGSIWVPTQTHITRIDPVRREPRGR